MRRRKFIVSSLALVSLPEVAAAQSPTRPFRIGWIVANSAVASAPFLDAFRVVLRRAVQRRREELQDNKRPLEGTAGPADDEECANRLINTLTLLDRLAGHVPDHLVSREELESASEILALLVGWFAGGIGGLPSGEDMPAAGGHPWGK